MSSLSESLDLLAKRRADRPAIIEPSGDASQANRTISFKALAMRARSIGHALVARGFAGARIALVLGPGIDFVSALFGIFYAGGCAVPLSRRYPEAERRKLLDSAKARLLIHDGSEALLSENDLRSLPLATLQVSDVSSGAPATRHSSAESAPGSPGMNSGESGCLLLFTSGTTGKPKVCVLTHDNVSSMIGLLRQAWRLDDHDQLLHALPLDHLHGLGIALLSVLLSGGSVRMLSKFDPERIWQELSCVTLFMGVPTMHKLLFDAFDAQSSAAKAEFGLVAKKLRLVTSGSAALPESIGRRWVALGAEYPLERFGMTEIGVGLSNPLDGPRLPGSAGQVLPGMQIRIVTDSAKDAGLGEPGEIWIRGPSVFSGYDGDRDATLAAFEDGWFKSGDTAVWLDAGFVKILGRTSVDIIKSAGYKLSAIEVEEALRCHPLVSDAAVIGVLDETWGERVVAFITLSASARGAGRDGAELEGTLQGWLRERLAAYKIPRRVLAVSELPRNALGKVIKAELKKSAALSSGSSEE